MKTFFMILLLVSIAFPLYQFSTSVTVMAHNQYVTRFKRLEDTARPAHPNAHLGLSATELSTTDEHVALAYADAVRDGYSLGSGYSELSGRCLGLDVLLFAASVVGLRACRRPGV